MQYIYMECSGRCAKLNPKPKNQTYMYMQNIYVMQWGGVLNPKPLNICIFSMYI